MWNDKSLKLNWKCKKPIISKKDLSNKNFNDINFRKFKDLQNLI